MDTFRWQTYEYEYNDKSPDWYWALAIIAISSAVTAILFENVLFALLILIGAFTVALFAVRKPNVVNFEINNRGVVIDRTLYQYQTLDSFWILYEDDGDRVLLIKSKKTMVPLIVVPLSEDVDVESLHNYLLERLEEVEMEEPIAHRFLEFLGF
ncbi:hypothetical protein COU17_02430 [Candidatus Kaiserbacteria bacterium CG10_big_fil_rev_8_21_14_0_10_49_17]|uniref:DUF5673 domain-containing protein n=1 Tax=Candidatus Kaiserbacteria bacterium CG10_big_fil_rev_8_21_14_0_10_49_17 TaxID=1974609 RepID=A0A2M6WE68_9BACT|nr:MAG: hypothetical protein COU17_02430 [Candidatus Kaiserbacteria bacterium CG10_big_fil_rev_8_21_14_0_10_49_17]